MRLIGPSHVFLFKCGSDENICKKTHIPYYSFQHLVFPTNICADLFYFPS